MICYILGDVFYLIICSEETLTKCYSELIMVKNECALIPLYDFLLKLTVPFLSVTVTSSMGFHGYAISSSPHLSFFLLMTEMDLNLSKWCHFSHK